MFCGFLGIIAFTCLHAVLFCRSCAHFIAVHIRELIMTKDVRTPNLNLIAMDPTVFPSAQCFVVFGKVFGKK